jgi:hypothetical protein
LLRSSAAVTPNNFLLSCSASGDDIQRDLKQYKNKRMEIQIIVGSDGITYPPSYLSPSLTATNGIAQN